MVTEPWSRPATSVTLSSGISFVNGRDIIYKINMICGISWRTFRNKVRTSIKIKFYKTLATPLLVRFGFWQQQRIVAYEIKFPRRVKGRVLSFRFHNVVIRNELGVEGVLERIRTLKGSCSRAVSRMIA